RPTSTDSASLADTRCSLTKPGGRTPKAIRALLRCSSFLLYWANSRYNRRMIMIKDRYLELAKELLANSKAAASITGDHVYEPANSANRLIIDKIVKDLLLPGSRLEGWDRLAELHGLAAQGKSCLILMEHYSNFDIPNLHYLTQQGGPNGLQIADSILPMAGMKLNQESAFVRAFTEAYSRIVIYPSRSLKALEGTDEWALEKKRSRQINMAALQQMVRKKHEGHIILLFPS